MAKLDSKTIEAILLKLPFKSVVRWMCTSRFWYNYIRSSKFSKKYLKKSMDDGTDRCLLLSIGVPAPTQFYRLAFDDNDKKIGDERPIDQPFDHPKRQIQVVGHSNGLICICSHSCPKGKLRKITLHDLAIWNPSISRFKRIAFPWYTVPSGGKKIRKYLPSYGFGYNPKVDNYEIVEIRQYGNLQTKTITSEVKIYSLGTNSWRRIADIDAKYNTFEIARGYFEVKAFSSPFVNGHMHWLMERYPRNSWKVLAFDIENEEFVDYGFPGALNMFFGIYLRGLGDQLYLISDHGNWIDLWRRKDYRKGGSWFRFYRLHMDSNRFVSIFPLVDSKTDCGTLYLAYRTLFWLDLKKLQKNVVHYLGEDTAFKGTAFVQSFLLGDGEPVPRRRSCSKFTKNQVHHA